MKNKQKGFVTALAITVLILLIIGGGVYIYVKKNFFNSNNTTNTTTTTNIVGNDKDEHGCIGSAGYSWCEVKNKCLRVWEEKCEVTTITTTTTTTTESITEQSNVNTLKPIIVYKTKADYSKFVPVGLSQDKTKIVSYPAPTDVYYNGTLAYPTTLNAGYLLDNRGVGLNSTFLEITYKEYSKLISAPSLSSLYSMIIDKNPFLELYDCKNGETQIIINNYINNNQLALKCVKII